VSFPYIFSTVKDVLRLDKQRRIDVRQELLESIGVEIPKGETIALWALVGPSGQLQLLPLNSRLSILRDTFENQTVATEWDAAGDENVFVYTQLQSFLRVTCHARKTGAKIRITLPAEAVKLGFVSERGVVSVVTNGRVLEIWNQEIWRQAGKISDLRSFTEDVEKALEELE
jgi:DNA-binding transcriptional regulator/RsmH inhibitor MraZ